MGNPLEAIIDEYFAAAKDNFQKENFQQAYKICLKILEIDAENSATLQLKKEIEDAVENYNLHLINKEIEKIEPLWKEERYEEIIKFLQQLYKSVPNYDKLEELLAKAQDLYRKQYEKKKNENIKNYEKELTDLLNQKKYNEIIEKIIAVEKSSSTEKKFRKLHEKIKDEIIEKKLEEKKELMQSEKYEEIVNFLYKLQYLHSRSEKIKKLLSGYREELLESQIEGKQDFIFRAKENINNLMLLKKYEDAAEACEDLLRIDPRNDFAKKTLQKAEKQIKKILADTIFDQMTGQMEKVKTEFQNNKKNFISL